MIPKIANISIIIDGMTCVSCENRIENTLRKARGIESVKVSYSNSRASITYDANMIDQTRIETIIESLDYKIKKPLVKTARVSRPDQSASNDIQGKKSKINQVIGIVILLAALYVIIKQFGGFNIFNAFPQAEQGMGYGLLFVIGLLTSIHCVAMCGGINISQCVPPQNLPNKGSSKSMNLRPSILYNTGRVISYTVIGGIVGALGSVVSFSGWAKGLVALAAGVFMVIMGLNMLNLFPWLRKFNPRMPKIFAKKINAEKQDSNRSPIFIGLLNGLMPCGPLQAMQLYALSTGSPIKGALSMLLFSLGTVPLMFGLGALSSMLSKKFTKKMMQVSAALVIILGIFMFQNGMSLSGLALPSLSGLWSSAGNSSKVEALVEPTIKDGIQIVTTSLSSGRYEPITVKAGIPVKWTINAAKGTINGCNNRLIIPAYNLEKKLEVGENVIEFTPDKTGTIPYSCWMGMIRSQITVEEGSANSQAVTNESASGSDVTTSTNDPSLSAGGLGVGAGGCCGAGAAGPSTSAQESIKLAEIVDGIQKATITVDGYGYSPQTLVLQRGLKTDLVFDVKQATGCSGKVYIPEFNLEMDLAKDGTIPTFTAKEDFTISCWMNMLGMNIKVVDDLKTADLTAIQDEIANAPQTVGGGCCG